MAAAKLRLQKLTDHLSNAKDRLQGSIGRVEDGIVSLTKNYNTMSTEAKKLTGTWNSVDG